MPKSTLRADLIKYAKDCPNGNFRADADAINTARQVEYQFAELYDIQYPDLDMANGTIVPINSSIPAGFKTFTYNIYGGTGVAAAINTYAANSIPRASYQAKPTTGSIVDLTHSYAVNVSDLETAAVTGIPLETGLGDACKRGHMQLRDSLGWYGSSPDGIVGLLTHPNITQLNSGFTWSTATFDQIAADFGTLINTPSNITNNVERVDTVVLPHAVWNNLSERPQNSANSANFTILSWLQNNYKNVQFLNSTALTAANHAGTDFAGKNVCVAFNRSKRKVSLIVSQDFTLYPPQWSGFESLVVNKSRCGGVMTAYPLSIVVMRGM